jgi:hypothetical protein
MVQTIFVRIIWFSFLKLSTVAVYCGRIKVRLTTVKLDCKLEV